LNNFGHNLVLHFLSGQLETEAGRNIRNASPITETGTIENDCSSHRAVIVYQAFLSNQAW